MSTTIDQRVVEMRFDNKDFERNVSETMSTLDKFKQKLNLSGASKGLENINTSASRINLSGLTSAVQTVQSKFSALEVMGVTALANITNSAVNAGKRITKALTIDPIMTGFSEYETKINAIQTIMSNTANKGTTMDDVTKTLNDLNLYADKTIYNFAEMTRNIGTFTAAGVGLEESASAIQGIANLAAASGSTSQQASTAMYQLSQALASGSVKLMDWNSVVNAGMGGQKFQEALKDTAREHGVAVDKIIKKSGSFRESLKEEWITADILNETLSKFTVDGAKKYADAMMESGKWTQAQADALMKEAQSMEDAATKVKTFTQLWSTLQEAAQSGWAQSWEIIVGNFDEAKDLLTEISDTIGGILNKSAESRNKILQEWKELGGRTAIVESLRNTFEGVASIVKPIKEAFREIFPPITAQQLLNFSNGLKNLTSKLKLSDENAAKLKSTFKGVFSLIDIGVTFVKEIVKGFGKLLTNFTGITGGILGASSSLGDWLSNLRDSIKEGDLFGKAVDKIVGFVQKFIDKIKELAGPGLKVFKAIFDFISEIGSNIGKAFGNSIRNGDIVSLIDIFNTGVLAGILLKIKSFIGDFSGAFENIGEVLDSFKGILESYQQDLQAKTLLKIATAIGILAAALLVLALIDPGRLGTAILAISTLFAELLGGLAVFGKIAGNIKSVFKAATGMIALASALLILSVALKIMSTMSWGEMAVGLVAMTVALGELIGITYALPKDASAKIGGIIKLAFSLVILGGALKIFATMSWSDIARSLTVMTVALGLFIGLTWALHKTDSSANTKGMIKIALSLAILGGALKILASMSWSDIGRSLTVMTVALGAFIGLAWALHKTNLSTNTGGMMTLALSLVVLGGALKILASMSWSDIGRSLTVMTVALGLLIGLAWALKASAAGGTALAMLGLATSLVVLGGALKIMGSMSWGSIVKGLVTIAGAFVIFGVAGLLLKPLVPTLISLAGAFALFGVSVLAIGVGLGLIAAGISALSLAVSTGTTAIVAGLTAIILGIVGLFPEIMKTLGECIVILCNILIECAPLIAETILVVISEVLASLAKHGPDIVESLFEFVIGLLKKLRDYIPDFIVVAVEIIGAFFKGVVDALNGLDTSNLLKGIIGLGLLTGLMMLLSTVASFIPGAMVGVLGMGLVIAELALVLAAVGALAQIPGLSWLIEEGGNFLQKLGTAIGQFVGGIIGGIAKGATSTLPEVGTNLSNFMKNLQPFIDGAKTIDSTLLEGVKSLAEVMLILTGANLLDSLTSWLTGGASLTDFGKELAEFGKYMGEYSNNVAGISIPAVLASSMAAKYLAEVADTIPSDGIFGTDGIDDFGKNVVTFGKKLKEYGNEVSGINAEAIVASTSPAKSLIELGKSLPKDGVFGTDGIDDFGKNVVTFGECLKKYGEQVNGLNTSGIVNSVMAAKRLVEIASIIPDDGRFGTDGIDDFGKNIYNFAKSLKKYSDKISEVKTESITKSVNAVRSLISLINSMVRIDASGINTFNDAVSKLGKANVDGFIKSFSDASSKIASSADKLVNNMAKSINSKSDAIKKSGVTLMESFIKGLTSTRTKAISALGSMINATVVTTSNYRVNFYNAGSYLVTGFADGIRDNQFKAVARARAMAVAAKEAAEAALGIQSPSKIFYKIGNYVVQGFTNALGDGSKSAYDAATDMANNARNGFSNVVGRISDMINNDMDSQPMIRPVLDLSEVESGVGALSGMFNDGPSIGVMSNLKAISSGMNSRNQNGTNNDIISAISKLGKSLGNAKGDTYNINGMTYDDGSNVADAVKQLYRAAKMERRV